MRKHKLRAQNCFKDWQTSSKLIVGVALVLIPLVGVVVSIIINFLYCLCGELLLRIATTVVGGNLNSKVNALARLDSDSFETLNPPPPSNGNCQLDKKKILISV